MDPRTATHPSLDFQHAEFDSVHAEYELAYQRAHPALVHARLPDAAPSEPPYEKETLSDPFNYPNYTLEEHEYETASTERNGTSSAAGTSAARRETVRSDDELGVLTEEQKERLLAQILQGTQMSGADVNLESLLDAFIDYGELPNDGNCADYPDGLVEGTSYGEDVIELEDADAFAGGRYDEGIAPYSGKHEDELIAAYRAEGARAAEFEQAYGGKGKPAYHERHETARFADEGYHGRLHEEHREGYYPRERYSYDVPNGSEESRRYPSDTHRFMDGKGSGYYSEKGRSERGVKGGYKGEYRQANGFDREVKGRGKKGNVAGGKGSGDRIKGSDRTMRSHLFDNSLDSRAALVDLYRENAATQDKI